VAFNFADFVRATQAAKKNGDDLSASARLAMMFGIENIGRRSRWGQLIAREGVHATQEFRRIEALPRRRWDVDPTLGAATEELNALLRIPGGDQPCSEHCRCPKSLWPNQAAALIELCTVHGLFGPIGVGKGKALITLLAPVVIGAERPVLFVPAQLRDQTLRKVIPMLRRHWRLSGRLRVVGYSELSLAKNKGMLHELAPDLILLDECHSVKNPQAARTKRLAEYMRQHPQTRVLAVSGSVTKRSLRDYWQLLLWALKPDLAPLPNAWRELADWADALDEGVPDEQRKGPGALTRLCDEGEGPRDGYRRRLVETPGVVATAQSELGVSLRIVEAPVRVPGIVLGHMDRMRTTWTTPYGDEIAEAVELWRHMRELACGFFYRWDPSPPAGWLSARKAWKALVRETLKHNRRGLDSELLVSRWFARLADEGRGDEALVKIWREWHEVKDTCKPNTVAEWVDPFALHHAAAWLQQSQAEPGEGGIAWTEHVAFAERLAELSGFRYFGAGMKASAEILDASGPIIASIAAHSEGKNLQRWSRSLVVAPPSSGKTWEQLLGRTHREGQEADEVSYEVWLHADELRASLRQALADARYIEQTTGARQKLLYADLAVGDLGEVA
jgi:hypothetical protein